ncbi:MFS transporter [Alicyclobacillus dauci]|uniref:MFS transporter n=1 Tax=Alicyclobacillus dauci TaxID=1475485 RepID=A0ABY6Z219_9BACL|nr:MFS transporter [Alicyclobacillus dauci]WAH36329.1 MFS transporter [Alicyclobacillus dauci]
MAVNQVEFSNVSNRLDRLPISGIHKLALIVVSFAYFFEFADTNTFSVVAPKLLKTWHLSIQTIGNITSISFLGMFIGAVIGGWIADKLGRKRALSATIIFFSLFSLLNAFSWNAASLGTFRFLTGVGLAAMTIVANTYISEMFPSHSRGKYQALAIVIGICGTPITSWIARLLVPAGTWGWRLVFVWGALGILCLVLNRKMIESPRWYESRKNYTMANKVMSDIESLVTEEKGPLPEPKQANMEAQAPKMRLAQLLRGRYLGITILLTVLWVAETIGFFGYSSWAPTLLVKHGITVGKSLTYVSLSTLGAPFGSYIAALIADRIDRKWTLVFSAVIIALSGLLYGLTFQPLLIVVFGLSVNVFERVFTAVAYAYTPELYPTEARGVGTGIPYGIGRLSNIFGPLIISALFVQSGYRSVFFFIAATWLIGAIVVSLFGPRTKKRSLDDVSTGVLSLNSEGV